MEKIKMERYMRLALDLAREGEGFVSPNPLVGAVLVKKGRILGKGFHRNFGGPHAEVEAIADAERNGHDVAESSLFVNLEPCAHSGKTPPCTDLILRKHIKRVVIGSLDPHPLAAGGAKKLIDAGTEVISGILETEAIELNRFFFHSLISDRPYVIVKAAISHDGMVAAAPATRTRISGAEATEFTHCLRHSCDAIMVGAGTVLADNPELTVRYGEKRCNPLRVVVDPGGKVANDARIFEDDRYLVLRAKCNDIDTDGMNVCSLPPNRNGRLRFDDILSVLHRRNIQSVLVEGGPTTISLLFREGLVDEMILIRSSMMRLPGGLPLFSGVFPTGFELHEQIKLGTDTAEVYHRTVEKKPTGKV